MNKNFKKLKDSLRGHNNSFKIIIFTETQLKDEDANKNSLYQIPNYTPMHLIRKGSCKGGDVTLFVHNSLNYKERHDPSKSSDIIETLYVEIINKNKKTILSLLCSVHSTVIENYLKMNLKM